MQFDGGVLRTGEAAAAENSDRHLKIPAVLLAEDVGSPLRSAEQGMQAGVDAHMISSMPSRPPA